MVEELGKIEKPPVEEFKKGRKLFFVPLIFGGKEPPEGYLDKFERYWEQVEMQLYELAAKLGDVKRIYHELVAAEGEEGGKTAAQLNEKSARLIRLWMERQAQLEAVEETDILTEFMDWNRCLLTGLQNPQVVTRVYEFYTEAAKKRNESIARRIDATLKNDEIGILFMRENHQVQFPPDIQVFYVAPPALDEIKRWLRDYEKEASGEAEE